MSFYIYAQLNLMFFYAYFFNLLPPGRPGHLQEPDVGPFVIVPPEAKDRQTML